MNLPTREQLQKISALREGIVASIYLPTEPRGPATRQSPIRFKNLVRDAHEQLVRLGADDVAAQLKEACVPLLADHDFWQHQTEGLGLLCDVDECLFYHLPFAPVEGVHTGRRFHIKPLLEAERRNRRFYFLALSLNQCRLFEGDVWSIKETDVPNLPRSMAEALRFDEPERSLQFHSSGREGGRQPTYHGQGSSADSADERTLRYFQACAKAIDAFLEPREKRPLLLAAVDAHVPIFQNTTSYAEFVANPHVSGNPDDAKPSDLHRRAQKIIRDLLENDTHEALEQFETLKKTAKACSGIEKVAAATVRGRVQRLLVAADKTAPGRIDLASGEVELGESTNGEVTVDLLNEAAAEVLRHGGDALLMPAASIPSSTQSLALLRY